MLLALFNGVDVSSNASNVVTFNGNDRAFFTIQCTSITGTGASLNFYAKNDTQKVVFQTYSNADLLGTQTLGLSFRGCPNEIEVEYVAGSNTGTLDIICNAI